MKHPRTEGVAYVEFLLVFMPVFVLFMGVAQLGLLFGARLLVQHAAKRAVRSAIVVLDDTPRYYNDEPRGFVSGPALGTGQLSAILSRIGFQVSTAHQPMLSRRATIEAAAAVPLVPLAPRGLTSLGGSLGSKGLSQSVAYTLNALSLDIPVAPATTPLGSVASTIVSVRVSYRYACGVPIAGRIVCPSGSKLLEGRASLPVQGARYMYR